MNWIELNVELGQYSVFDLTIWVFEGQLFCLIISSTVSTKYAFNISATFCRFVTMPVSVFNAIFLSDEEHLATCLFIKCHIFLFCLLPFWYTYHYLFFWLPSILFCMWYGAFLYIIHTIYLLHIFATWLCIKKDLPPWRWPHAWLKQVGCIWCV